MPVRTLFALAVVAWCHVVVTPAGAQAPGTTRDPVVPDLRFADVWLGGPLDSIYNAEYARLAEACAGQADACHEAGLDTTAVRLGPTFSEPGASQPSGWIAARLRARGRWPYAGLVFVHAEGGEVPLIDDVGDWGYGTTLDLLDARGEWIRPRMLEAAGGHWIGPGPAPGLGVVEGAYGLEGRLWRFESVSTASGAPEVPGGVYLVLEVAGGVVTFRPEIPTDMACGEPVDTAVSAAEVPVHRVPVARLLDPDARPRVEVAYPRGC